MDNRDDRAAGHGRRERIPNGSGGSGGSGGSRRAAQRAGWDRPDSERRDSRSSSSRRDRWDEYAGEEPTSNRKAPEDRPTRSRDRDRPPPREIAPDRWLSNRGRAGASARHASKEAGKGRGKRPKNWRLRAVVIGVLVCLLIAGTTGAVDAYGRYTRLRTLASDGTHHLRVVQGLLQGKSLLSQLTSPTTLPTLTAELVAAQRDFHQLRGELGAPGGTLGIAEHLPSLGNTITTAATLAAAADEACQAGLILTDAAKPAVAWLKSGFFAKTVPAGQTPPPPALTQAQLDQITTDWGGALAHLDQAIAFARTADLSAIPTSILPSSQATQLRTLLSKWDGTRVQLTHAGEWLAVLPTLLGVKAPLQLLVMLQDRSELRATGGFMGNYAQIAIRNGQLQPFKLHDTYTLDYPYVAAHGDLPKPPKITWWPWNLFALRDANLFADFPTSARLEMQFYQKESGESVQGVVAITPALMISVLKVVGNVPVPSYSEVVTPSNLESLIHKYQLGSRVPVGSTRKAFTAALAQEVMTRLHGLPLAKLNPLLDAAVKYLHTKDIQVYLADPKIEALFSRAGFDGSMAHGPGDAVSAVDANITGSKANQYVTVKYADTVTLAADGTAMHHLTITYVFRATNLKEIYGPDYYHFSARVYTPPGAKLASSNGFPAGPGQLGTSDETGRQMWGCLLTVQDGVPYTLSLAWSVAHAATRDTAGKWHYSLNFQHQAGSNQQLALTITPPGAKAPAVKYTGVLDTDKTFTVAY